MIPGTSLIVFYTEHETKPNADDQSDDGKRRVARASFVFNAAQVDGYTVPGTPERLGTVERIAAADRFVSATGGQMEHGGERAFYRPATDHIQMPEEGLFCDTQTMSRTEGYYVTLLNELTHYAAFRIMPRRPAFLRTGAQSQRGISA